MTAARDTRHPCKARGCTLRIRGNADYCSEHSGSRHGRIPTVVARIETAAATAMQCPKCKGPVRRDGTLVSCLDRAEDRPDACGWVELMSRVVRTGVRA